MEFVLLIFVNIIMGTIFYLILRLKLEKYASDYREKRLRKEMDDIICEFNETAERNISILEKRIDVLKKLLEKAGTINKIDINIDDSNEDKRDNILIENDNNIISGTTETEEVFDNNKILEQKLDGNNIISKYHFIIKRKFETIFKSVVKHKDQKNSASSDNSFNSLIDLHQLKKSKDFYSEDLISSNPKQEENSGLSEFELKEMFLASEDKYSLISELNNRGYPVDIIAKCSGIPIGEINLVLDLNSNV